MDTYTRAELAVVLHRYGLSYLSLDDIGGHPEQYPDHYVAYHPGGAVALSFARIAGRTEWVAGVQAGQVDGLPDKQAACAAACELLLGRRQPTARQREAKK